MLRGLVRLSAQVSHADCAQLSLLADQQVATAVRCDDGGYADQLSPLEESICTVTALSGDVLVAADAASHPWLHDLPPVRSGAVGSSSAYRCCSATVRRSACCASTARSPATGAAPTSP